MCTVEEEGSCVEVQAHDSVTYPVRIMLDGALTIEDENRLVASCKRAANGRDRS